MTNYYASIIENAGDIATGVAALATVGFAAATFRSRNTIRKLKEDIDYLTRKVHRVTSTVDPESDRRLVEEAVHSVQILGINALGPLHHAREAMINFLRPRANVLRIILLDPESSAFRDREDHENDSFKRILAEWIASVTILKGIEARVEGRIEIRLRRDSPDRSLLIIDAANGPETKSKMLINYYPEQRGMRGYSGMQFLSEYVAERDRDSFFKNKSHFDLCWNDALPTSVDELIEKYVSNKNKS